MEPQKRRNYKKRKRLLALFSLFMGVVFLCTGCRAAEMAEGALSRLYHNLMEELSLEKPGQENQGNGKNSWESQSLEIGKYPIPQEWEENTFSTFFQLMYERPDLEDLQEQMWALLDDIAQQSRSPQELLEETERIIQLYDEAYTQYVLADLRYSLDITDAFFASEVSFLPEDMGKCQQLLNQILAALFSDASLAEQAESRWGEERAVFLQRQGETGEDSQRLVELLEREQEILYEYNQLLIHTSVAYQGQEWTEWELYQDTSLTLEEYQEAYALLLEDLGESAGELFCQLVAVRQEMAKEEGYDSYAEYAYQETYFRDYSPREAKLLQEYVKRYVVPLYGELWLDWYDGDSQRLYEQTYDSEECLQALLEVADSLSPEFAQAGKLLRQGQLYDLSASEGKLNQSFTVYLDSYQGPLPFQQVDRRISGPHLLDP